MNRLKTLSGSILLLTTAVLWINFPTGCKKAPDPVLTLGEFFDAARACDQTKMRSAFSSALLGRMDRIFQRGSAILGAGLKLDIIQGMCKAYKTAKWHVISKETHKNTATVSTRVNNQDIRFFMRFQAGRWQIYSMTSPGYRIDEQGLHSVK